MRSRGSVAGSGALAGILIGWLLAQHRFERSRRDLFSRSVVRRLGALGFLAGQSGVERVRLLRDYLEWETHPVLRRRARSIVRRLEAEL